MFGCRFWQCRGAVCPVLKTDEMSQAVGIGQDGRLWTAPTTGAALDPVAKTQAMTQAVGVDGDGKLWTEPTGGNSQITGTGTLRDMTAQLDVGTFDYVINGKIMTVRLHVPNSWQTTSLGVSLSGLPAGVSFGINQFGFVYQPIGDSTTIEGVVQFNIGGVSIRVGGVLYAYQLVYVDGYTFTLVLN